MLRTAAICELRVFNFLFRGERHVLAEVTHYTLRFWGFLRVFCLTWHCQQVEQSQRNMSAGSGNGSGELCRFGHGGHVLLLNHYHR
jgi:hypothetical protein